MAPVPQQMRPNGNGGPRIEDLVVNLGQFHEAAEALDKVKTVGTNAWIYLARGHAVHHILPEHVFDQDTAHGRRLAEEKQKPWPIEYGTVPEFGKVNHYEAFRNLGVLSLFNYVHMLDKSAEQIGWPRVWKERAARGLGPAVLDIYRQVVRTELSKLRPRSA